MELYDMLIIAVLFLLFVYLYINIYNTKYTIVVLNLKGDVIDMFYFFSHKSISDENFMIDLEKILKQKNYKENEV